LVYLRVETVRITIGLCGVQCLFFFALLARRIPTAGHADRLVDKLLTTFVV